MPHPGDKTFYEWAIVYRDEYGDGIEVDHAETFSELLSAIDDRDDEGLTGEIELVRDYYSNGTLNRSWSFYNRDTHTIDDMFSDTEEDTAKVPKRFHDEVSKCTATTRTTTR